MIFTDTLFICAKGSIKFADIILDERLFYLLNGETR